MKKLLVILVFVASALVGTAKSSSLSVGSNVFIQDDDRILLNGSIRTYYPKGETNRKWTHYVSITEDYTERDPKLYLAKRAQLFFEQVPDLKFVLTEDKSNGDWILDFVVPARDLGQTAVAWSVFKVRKTKNGIVVFQHSIRYPYKKSASEVVDAVTKDQKELTSIIYAVEFEPKK